MVEPIKIGRFIAQNRKNLNLTQKELAEKLGVTDRAVSKWENGRSIPDVGIIESLCKELNMSIGESIVIGVEIAVGFIIVVGVAIIQSKTRKEEWEEENNDKKSD